MNDSKKLKDANRNLNSILNALNKASLQMFDGVLNPSDYLTNGIQKLPHELPDDLTLQDFVELQPRNKPSSKNVNFVNTKKNY